MTSNRLKGARILILEDEPLLSAVIESAVSQAGCEIVGPASDIETALSLILTEEIDAAILDLIVNSTYCDEVAEQLAARGVRFAITTGLGTIQGHPALLAAPRITKPFRAEYVQDVLATLLAD